MINIKFRLDWLVCNWWTELIQIPHSSLNTIKCMRFGERKKVRKCFPVSSALELLTITSLETISDGIENKCRHKRYFLVLNSVFQCIFLYLYKIKVFIMSYFIEAVLWNFLPFLTTSTVPANAMGVVSLLWIILSRSGFMHY